jgi:sugar phosphate isomerase/epimerase
MKISQIAVQLYTLRDFCQDAAALRASLQKVREIGYGAVQVSGIGDIAPAEVAAICAEVGVKICATHEGSDLIRQEPERAVERLRAYGVTTTAYPYPAGVDFADPTSVQTLLNDLRRAGEVFKEAGCKLCYHNHAIEFIRYGEGTLLEAIRDSIPADVLQFELDTYWVQYGGGDPVRWCQSVPGRLPVIHLKDYQFTTENKPIYCEVGQGNLDFPRIIAAAEESGCAWFVVEQDSCPGDPFISIEQSFAYLRDHIVR